jgi:hypothetical protein
MARAIALLAILCCGLALIALATTRRLEKLEIAHARLVKTNASTVALMDAQSRVIETLGSAVKMLAGKVREKR